mgnify:CR=1 FL=1|jgi:hypothetical protein
METSKKTTFPSEVVHFTVTVAGVGDSLTEAFSDALGRLYDDPYAAIFGDVEYTARDRSGSLQVCPIEDAPAPISVFPAGVDEAEA